MIILPKILCLFEYLQYTFNPVVIHFVQSYLWKWDAHYHLGSVHPILDGFDYGKVFIKLGENSITKLPPIASWNKLHFSS